MVDDPRTTHLQFAHGLAVPWKLPAYFVHDAQLHTQNWVALLCLDVPALLIAQRCMFLERNGNRPQRRHLGHTPGVEHIDAQLTLVGLDQRTRHGRAADDQRPYARDIAGILLEFVIETVPDRRHTCCNRDPFIGDQVGQRLGLEMRPGHDDFGAGSGARIGQSPRHGVKLGHNRQHNIRLVTPRRIGRVFAHGVQEHGTVPVERPLGVTGGAAGVAHAHCHGFVGTKPRKILVRSVDQIFVEEDIRQLIRGLTRRIEEDVVLTPFAFGATFG